MKQLLDGIHPAVHRDDYDQLERVNISTLCVMERSAAHYHHALTTPTEDTDPMRVGRVVHVAAFEPERYRSLVAVWDEKDNSGNPKARRGPSWEAFKAKNRGRELLTEAQAEKVNAIASKVRAHPRASQFISDGRGEVTMLWTMNRGEGVNAYTVHAKGRIDFDGELGLVDLKTAHNGSPEGFGRQTVNLQYDAKLAWYSDAHTLLTGKRKDVFVIAAESEPPYEVTVYRVTEQILQRGREKYSAWLDRLAWCRETNRWPGYAEDVIDLELPGWALGNDGGAIGLDFSE